MPRSARCRAPRARAMSASLSLPGFSHTSPGWRARDGLDDLQADVGRHVERHHVDRPGHVGDRRDTRASPSISVSCGLTGQTVYPRCAERAHGLVAELGAIAGRADDRNGLSACVSYNRSPCAGRLCCSSSFAARTFFAGLGRPAIGDSDEAFYAEAGREMVAQRRLDHPVLQLRDTLSKADPLLLDRRGELPRGRSRTKRRRASARRWPGSASRC